MINSGATKENIKEHNPNMWKNNNEQFLFYNFIMIFNRK